jgi:hypothetical protein
VQRGKAINVIPVVLLVAVQGDGSEEDVKLAGVVPFRVLRDSSLRFRLPVSTKARAPTTSGGTVIGVRRDDSL